MVNAADNTVIVRLHGVDEARQRFENYGNRAHRILETVLIASGAKVVAESKDRCPVDTGRLKGSIGEVGDPDGIWQLVPINHQSALKVGTSVEYAWEVETLDRPHGVGQAHYMEEGAHASIIAIQGYFVQGIQEAERTL